MELTMLTGLLLGRRFDYPDILRKPTDTILRQYKAGGASLRRLWYIFMFSAVLFTPVPVMVQQGFQPDVPGFLTVLQRRSVFWRGWFNPSD